MSGTAHHGLGGLIPEIERFFEARYWPSGPHPGIETGKLSSVGECRVRNIKWYCFGDASTSLCSHYGIFVELDYDDDHQPEWRIRFKSDCSALVNILERNLSLIEQACASREAKHFAAIAEQKLSRTGFEILPALFGFAQRLGPELGLAVAEGGLFPKAGWMLPVAWAKEKALAFLRQNDPSLEDLALSDFDADYEFSRHHRFALIENLPWTASLLADWMAGQLARMPIDETTANGGGHRLGVTAAGDAVIPDGPFGVNSFRWKGKEYDAPDGKPFLLLSALWVARDRTLNRSGIATALGDSAEDRLWGANKGLATKLNDFFRKEFIPLFCTTRENPGVIELQDRSA